MQKICTAEVSRDRCESDGGIAPDHVLKISVLSDEGGLEQQR